MAQTRIDGSQTTETERGRMEAIFVQFEPSVEAWMSILDNGANHATHANHFEREAIELWEDGDLEGDLTGDLWAASEDGDISSHFELQAKVWAAI